MPRLFYCDIVPLLPLQHPATANHGTIKMPAAQWRTNLVLQLQQCGVGFVDGEGARDLGCALHLGHHDHILATRLGPVGQALEMEQNQHDDR